MKAQRSTGSGGFRAAYYTDEEYMYNDDDMDYIPPARKKTAPISGGGKERPGLPKRPAAQSPPPGAGGQSTSPGKAARSRPTNNQLLYKAYFRWAHYPHKLKSANMPDETDACASVTAAFLQVLQIMQTAEQLRHGNNKRNVLQILSSNTRRTKVVELSSGTHRVPDELKKHYLSDGEGGQYSTNLDRNRYGNDDNYLFTVIRYDLEFLGLCPCMVDVEIIDAKQGNTSIIVSAGLEVCTCQAGPPAGGGPLGGAAPVASGGTAGGGQQQQQQHYHHPHHHPAAVGGGHHHHQVPPPAATLSGGGHAAVKTEYGASAVVPHAHLPVAGGGPGGYGGGGAAAAVGPPDVGNLPPLFGPGAFRGGPQLGGGALGRESPKRSGTSVSQLFDALVMAATGGADGAAAAGGLGGEPPVTSPAHADRPERGGGGPGGGGMGMGPGGGGPARLHGPPGRNKSKLWSLNNLSYGGEVDSLQNALDAFREQDEIASGDPAAFLTGGGSQGGPDGSLQRSDSLRQRRRKPLRNSSVLGRPASSGGGGPLLGAKMGVSMREKSDDNLKLTADPGELGGPLALGGSVGFQGGMAGGPPLAQGHHQHHHLHGAGGGGQLGGGGATHASSLASGEDDNDNDVGGGEADAEDALAAKGEDLGVEGEGEAGGEEEAGEGEEGHGGGMAAAGQGGGGAGGGGVGPTASGTLARASGLPPGRAPLRHHVRHVPRQSSVANLGPRLANSSGGGGGGANAGGGGGQGGLGGLGMLGPGGLGGSASAAIAGEQLRRLATELEVVRSENRSLRQQLQRANSSSANGLGTGGGGSPSLGHKQLQQSSDNQAGNNDSARLRKLEAELSSMRSELLGLSGAKRSADEENRQLKRELLVSQQQVAALLSRVLGAAAATTGPAQAGVAGGASGMGVGAAQGPPAGASILASLLGGHAGVAASAGVAAPPQQQPPHQPMGAGAFDPSSFAAQQGAMRQTSPTQQQQNHHPGGNMGTVAAQEGRTLAYAGVGGHAEALLAATAAAHAAAAAAGGRRSEPGAGVVGYGDEDTGAQAGRKRTANEAGLATLEATGAGDTDARLDAEAVPQRGIRAAALPSAPDLPGCAAAKLGQPHQHQQLLQQLPSMPTFSPAIPAAATATTTATSLAVFPRPADSGAAGTPADSNCFSDVAQLLALPNLDGGFTSSDPLVEGFGGAGAGARVSGDAGSGGALAAASGVQVLGSGSGSGSASVPQMPSEHPHPMLLGGHYVGHPHPHSQHHQHHQHPHAGLR